MLKSDHVEIIPEPLAHDLGGRNRCRRAEGDTQTGNGPDAIGVGQSQRPNDSGTPVMADEHRLLLAKRIEYSDQILADICRAVNVLKPSDTSELNEKQFEADVKIKNDFNNLAKIKAIVSGSSPSPSPSTAGAAKPGGW